MYPIHLQKVHDNFEEQSMVALHNAVFTAGEMTTNPQGATKLVYVPSAKVEKRFR